MHRDEHELGRPAPDLPPRPTHPTAGAPVRRSLVALGSLLVLLGLLPACRTYWSMSEELEERIHSEATLAPPVDDDDAVAELGRDTADGRMPLPEAYPLPDPPTLDDYVHLALEHNPRIQARIREVEALGLRVPQVTSLSDPMLSVVPPTPEMTQTAAGEMRGSIGLSQGIPFPGKLDAKGRIAEQIVRVALANLRQERLRVVAEVKRAYYEYDFSLDSITVTRELQSLLERMRDIAQARYEAGKNPQQDVLRAEVELYDLSNVLITLEQEHLTAVARLNILMDRDVRADLPAPRPFDPEQVPLHFEDLIIRAAAGNPELAGLQELVKADLEAIRLAKLQYYPDFNLGALFTFISGGLSPVANGDDTWNLLLGANLPIWFQRLRAGVLQRNAETMADSLRYRSKRNELAFAIQDLAVRVDADYRSALLLRDAIVPRARRTVEVSESGYQAGSVDFLTLVDNWRRLLELTLQYHRSLSTLEQHVAALEEIVGGPLRAPHEPSDEER